MKCSAHFFLVIITLALLFAGCAGGIKTSTNSREFLVGGDISMLTKIEELGGAFHRDGIEHDFFDFYRGHVGNIFRLRLFVNPNYKNAVINDLPYTLALAKRIKKNGMKLLLNFHYSDTWADPNKQSKPKAWQELNFEDLEKQVEDYSHSVIAEFKESGVLPDIVQVGNEVMNGFLWPEGKIGSMHSTDKQWRQFSRLLKAGIRGVNQALDLKDNTRIMIHIDQGGNWSKTEQFFDNLEKRGIPFDMIGLSYYPWMHGSMEALQKNLHETAQAYGKDIVVVETAYPYCDEQRWKTKENMEWRISPEGQHAFMVDLIRTIQQTPNGFGAGVLYWYPESIPIDGIRVWNDGTTALFDKHGNALPAMETFQFLN